MQIEKLLELARDYKYFISILVGEPHNRRYYLFVMLSLLSSPRGKGECKHISRPTACKLNE